MAVLEKRLYHKKRLDKGDLKKYMQIFYPNTDSFDSYYDALMSDVAEYTAEKHRPTFKKEKEYEQMIPRIQLGIKILCTCEKYDTIADIYSRLEENKTRLLGYGFGKWIYDLTILSAEDISNIFVLMPNVYKSWLQYYKLYPYDIKSFAEKLARSGNKNAFEQFRTIVQETGRDVADVDSALIKKKTIHISGFEEDGHTHFEYDDGLIHHVVDYQQQ